MSHPATALQSAPVRPVPDYLVKEVLDGIPVYYRGYREVLDNTKTKEEIMADGLLQAFLKNCLHTFFVKKLDEDKYWVFVGEVGSHLSHKNNLAHDLTIFSTAVLTPDKIQNKYADVPAKVIIEIDSEVEYGGGRSNEEYVHRKTQRVLDFGTAKVIWVFTASRKIMVATPTEDWRTFDWNREVEALEGVTFNIPALLEKKNITLPGG